MIENQMTTPSFKNIVFKDSLSKRELIIDGVVTYDATPVIITSSDVSNEYKMFEKELNQYIGQKLKFTDTVTDKTYIGYYFGLCENTNGKNGASYFLSNIGEYDKPFTTFPYGIINEFTYQVVGK